MKTAVCCNVAKGNGIGCWPGNTNDAAILPEVKDALRGWRGGRVITVVDRGFSSAANLAYLRRAGGHYIAGEAARRLAARRRGAGPAGPLLHRPGQPAGQGGHPQSTPGVRWI